MMCLPATQQEEKLALAATVFEHDLSHRFPVCQMMLAALETPLAEGSLDVRALTLWRGRLKQAQENESRAWEELTQTPCFQSISRHGLSEFVQGELQAKLAQCKPVTRAWLVRKNLKQLADRRCYILFVDLPGLDDETRYEFCRHMESTLDLPGSVLALWAGESPTLAQIHRQAFEPVYLRTLG